jgi:hypothetical protein
MRKKTKKKMIVPGASKKKKKEHEKLLDLEIQAGVSLGPFVLGADLSSLLPLLRSFGRTTLRLPQPRTSPLVVHLEDVSVQLLFGADTHRLVVAEAVGRGSRANLGGLPVSGATSAALASTFGAERAPRWGLEMAGSSGLPAGAAGGARGVAVAEFHGVALGFDEAGVCSRVSVLPANSSLRTAIDDDARVPPEKSVSVDAQGRATFTDGPRRAVVSESSSPQEVISSLGKPEGVYHRLDASGKLPSPTGDYYYNYYRLGVDIMFDGVLHTVKRMVFHANHPQDTHFGRYSRCHVVFAGRPGVSLLRAWDEVKDGSEESVSTAKDGAVSWRMRGLLFRVLPDGQIGDITVPIGV